jgi:hypothetical protein
MTLRDIIKLLFYESSAICDFLILGTVKPFPLTGFRESIEEKKLLLREIFYHEPYIPVIKNTNKVMKELSLFYLLYLFRIDNFLKLFTHRKIDRNFMVFVYMSFLKMIKNFNYKNIIILFKLLRKHSPQEKIETLVEYYKNYG